MEYRFTKQGKIGEGNYGTVYKAMDNLRGCLVALKRMATPNEEDGVPASTIREIVILRELRHENIVRLHDVMFQVPRLTLVFEYCQWDLKKYQVSLQRPFTTQEIRDFLRQILLGLSFIHSRSVVHRDLKPQNILLNEKMQIKIADFGLSRVTGVPVKKYSHEVVTMWYRAPDVMLGSVFYGFAIDVWSVGCIFAEMASGVPLLSGMSKEEQLLRMFKLLGTPPEPTLKWLESLPDAALLVQATEQHHESMFYQHARKHFAALGDTGIDLLFQMMQYRPEQRITPDSALQHPFFTSPSTAVTPVVPVEIAPTKSLPPVSSIGSRPSSTVPPSEGHCDADNIVEPRHNDVDAQCAPPPDRIAPKPPTEDAPSRGTARPQIDSSSLPAHSGNNSPSVGPPEDPLS